MKSAIRIFIGECNERLRLVNDLSFKNAIELLKIRLTELN